MKAKLGKFNTEPSGFYLLVSFQPKFSIKISEQNFSRLKTQYENELREMERTQMTNRDKYAEMRTKLAEGEASIQNFQATVKQLELQLEHSKKV